MTKPGDSKKSLLVEHIIEGIRRKKGKSIVSIDLRGLQNAVCEYFIIASGDSKTQVGAISDSVEDVVWEQSREWPHHKEGVKNAQWILLDYVNIVVHIFQREHRNFYNLESLWADGAMQVLPEEEGR
jgi:ribosome-associated protein